MYLFAVLDVEPGALSILIELTELHPQPKTNFLKG